ncbi:MAG TPA: hypothetical protein VKT51_08205 [Candidatus Eremiobacteraceae bacterium]|nr:hypothetical protein [Candidatus Eremiobacteraceae bacterium]
MIAIFAAYAFANFASSPQQAALNALYQPKGTVAVVERMNVVGRYAAVLTHGGLMEGSAVIEPILVERFSFGWQALDVLYFQCQIDGHGISRGDGARLMRSLPAPKNDRPCRGVRNDSGPVQDIEAIRRQMDGRLIPYVVVSANYAIGGWYGGGGGATLFKKRVGGWHRIAGGGGAIGVAEMREYGVPQSDWCAFGIYDAICPHKS